MCIRDRPEGRLLLHPLAHAPQHLAVIQGKHLLHLLVSLPGEGGVRPGVQLRHLGNGRLREIVPVIGDHHHAPLGVGVLPNGSALQQQLAAVGAVYAGKVADDGGLSGAVGANQPIYRPLGYGEGGAVQCPEAVKALDHLFCLKHSRFLLSTRCV